jgi:hypothetical protein
MINIITVHWKTAKWIDLQLGQLGRNIDGPFRVFASLDGIDDPSAWPRFHYATALGGGHPRKLNELARAATEESDPGDVLIFLDGDAFPVQPLVPWIERTLADHPLAAVRRLENAGDLRPHPSFCVTTVGFWQAIGGDWRAQPWTNADGQEFFDAGTVLFHQLDDRGVDWLPMLRTNTCDLHPLWFGIYDHRIYHHGAGFRGRISAADASQVSVKMSKAWTGEGPPSLGELSAALRNDPSDLLRLRPRHIPMLGRSVMKSARRSVKRRYERRAEAVSDRVFERLRSDPSIFHELDDAVHAPS